MLLGVPCPSLAVSSLSLLPLQMLLSSQTLGLLLKALQAALFSRFLSACSPSQQPVVAWPLGLSLEQSWAPPCQHIPSSTHSTASSHLWSSGGPCQLPVVPQSSPLGQSQSSGTMSGSPTPHSPLLPTRCLGDNT